MSLYYLFLCLVMWEIALFPQGEIVPQKEEWTREDSTLFSTIQADMKPLLDQHISQKAFDDAYVQRAGFRFVALLDPDNRYLLSLEADLYLRTKDGFSASFRNGSLRPFWDLFLMKVTAVERAQKMRKALLAFLSSHSGEIGSFRPHERRVEERARDEDELLLYQTDFLLSHIPQDAAKKSSQEYEMLLAQADRKIGAEEQEWIEAQNEPSKRSSLFHSLLLSAFTKALDLHSEILAPKEAEELREALTQQEGKFCWEVVESVSGSLLVLTLDSFYRGRGGNSPESDIRRAWGQANSKQPVQGVLLDLRKNRGGFLLEAVKLAGLFIKSGVIVVVEYSDGSRRYFRDLDPNVLMDCPTVVLTTHYTASAAEIVAQALHDYGVGIIVGDEHTYGKGSVQMQTVSGSERAEEENGAHYKLTIGEFYGVSGEAVQSKGVPADIVVPSYYSLFSVGERFMGSGLPEPQKTDSFFQDPLTDIASTSLSWYRNYYIPFLQKPKNAWKTVLPGLQQKSLDRRMKESFWRAYAHGDWKVLQRFVPKGESLESYFEKAQKKEALCILEDMVCDLKAK